MGAAVSVNATKIYQFEAKALIWPCPLWWGNISEDFTANDTKKLYYLILVIFWIFINM